MLSRLGYFLGVLALSSGAALAQDLTREAESARGAILQLRQVMMQHLQTSLVDASPAEIAAVCRHLTPEIAAAVSAETGWQIRRPALKVRNPENRPSASERGVLLGYLSRDLAGQPLDEMETVRLVEQDGETYVHYMRAIPTLDACLLCHGSDLAPEVAATIKQAYPEDAAVGFEVGDLRGAFSLMRRYRPGDAPVVAAAPLPALPAGAPSARPGGRGYAAKGRELFGQHCLSCHHADDMALHLYPKGGEGTHGDVSIFLRTHGLTNAENDCDIVAYMKALARQAAQ